MENICHYFKQNKQLTIDSIWTHNPKAGVIDRMAAHGYVVRIYQNEAMQSGALLAALQARNIAGIVLAGFLRLIPSAFVAAFPNKIINIHPALLPKYGGKGMYGDRVHQTVWENKEKQTGITIHYVNEVYDAGTILFQQSVALDETDTPEQIAQKVHALEYEHYPKIIANVFESDV